MNLALQKGFNFDENQNFKTLGKPCPAPWLKRGFARPKMPGYKQELANFKGASSHGSQAPTGTSSLCRHLLHMWSIGEISACACQSIAQAAHIAGINHESVVKLAAAGGLGKAHQQYQQGFEGYGHQRKQKHFCLANNSCQPMLEPKEVLQ